MPRIRVKAFLEQAIKAEVDSAATSRDTLVTGEYEKVVRYRADQALKKLGITNFGQFISRASQEKICKFIHCYLAWVSTKLFVSSMRSVRSIEIRESQVIFAVESKMMWLESMRYFFTTDVLILDPTAPKGYTVKLINDLALDQEHYNQLKAEIFNRLRSWCNKTMEDWQKQKIEEYFPNTYQLVKLYTEKYNLSDDLKDIINYEVDKLFACKLIHIDRNKPILEKSVKDTILEVLDYLFSRWQIEQEIRAKWLSSGFEPKKMAPINLEGYFDLKNCKHNKPDPKLPTFRFHGSES